MERVAFLIERTGDRLSCLLNPETLTVRRQAGLARRGGTTGPLHAAGMTDDPLVYTGGGSTEMTLDLLFDTTLASGTAPVIEDVRLLTRPLWDLAENRATESGDGTFPFVWFVWGRAWTVPGVIGAVAERLESFTDAGVPRRSWLRMRFLRVTPPMPATAPTPIGASDLERLRPTFDRVSAPERRLAVESPTSRAVEVTGGATEGGGTPTRLDELAFQRLGDARLWRLLAWFNNVADPLRLSAGTLLQVPPRPVIGGRP